MAPDWSSDTFASPNSLSRHAPHTFHDPLWAVYCPTVRKEICSPRWRSLRLAPFTPAAGSWRAASSVSLRQVANSYSTAQFHRLSGHSPPSDDHWPFTPLFLRLTSQFSMVTTHRLVTKDHALVLLRSLLHARCRWRKDGPPDSGRNARRMAFKCSFMGPSLTG